MNITAVDACIEDGTSHQNSGSQISFTADDVLAAYIKGKNFLSDEVRTILNRTIPLAIKRAPEVVNDISSNSGVSIPSIFMKVNDLSGYDILCLVPTEDYFSSTKMRKAYVVASGIEEQLFDNSFTFGFRFIMQSDALNEKNVLSERYRRLPK